MSYSPTKMYMSRSAPVCVCVCVCVRASMFASHKAYHMRAA